MKDTGALAGWITLERRKGELRRGALGYWLGEAYHGRGFAREALVAVVRAGFGLLDVDVIEAGAQTENAKSFAVMRACGMSEAGMRMVYAASRCRSELCQFYEIGRGGLV
jgi:ribosomal-protein-alanine N-acetyltransferase